MRNADYKYFLYARKSSESEDRQMASIEDQIAEVNKLAEKYNIKVIDVISESKSAKEPGRVGFNSMLQRIHKGEAQGILTWKLNRLARNPIDGGQISWMLQQNIIKHIQTFERDYNPADNVLLMQVEFGMANQYIKDLSLDVKRGMRQKAERGWYPTTILPLGYKHKSNYILGVDAEIVPNEEQFHIIRKLWELLLTGQYSIADLKRKGDVMGLKGKNNKTCSRHAYYNLFSNEFYCGYYYWTDKDGNMIRHKGKHKLMVNPSEFQKAQVILHKDSSSVTKIKKYNFPYRGIIKCGECGCMVIPDHKLQVICTNCKYKYSIKTRSSCPKCGMDYSKMENPSIVDILYYHCSKSRGKCLQGSITKEIIELFVENELKKISLSQQRYSWTIEKVNHDAGENLKREENIIKSLKKRKTELEDRTFSLVNLRADGEIDSEQFNLSISKTRDEISTIENEIKSKEISTEWYEEKRNACDFALDILEKYRKSDDPVKTQILRQIASNLTLKGKKLEITMEKSLLDLVKWNST